MGKGQLNVEMTKLRRYDHIVSKLLYNYKTRKKEESWLDYFTKLMASTILILNAYSGTFTKWLSKVGTAFHKNLPKEKSETALGHIL